MPGLLTFDTPGVQASGGGGHVENVDIAENADDISTNSAISTSLSPQAVWPSDSVLEDFVRFARGYSESEDAIIIGSILPMVSRLLARRVFIRFGVAKYSNLYHVLTTKPGLRKSTTIQVAEYMAKALLPPSAFVGGASSEQALFKSYQVECDKLWIEDEGNTILSNWSNDAAGKIVAKRMLKLYDCRDWRQNYIRQKDEDGAEDQIIEQTSTSLLIGTTFNNCRFNGLETRDGMRRRVCYYVSEKHARQIDWPEELGSGACTELIQTFSKLLTLTGEVTLSDEAKALWSKIQTDNRHDIESIDGIDYASEAHGSMLSESPAKILKRALIFEVCRWAKDTTRNWKQIRTDTLELAAEHERYCLSASQLLDTIGTRAETRNMADSILAKVRTSGFPVDGDNWIRLTRSQLTAKFAPNPGRRGEMTPERLYTVILPDLIQRRLARLDQKRGKLEIYAFLADQ